MAVFVWFRRTASNFTQSGQNEGNADPLERNDHKKGIDEGQRKREGLVTPQKYKPVNMFTQEQTESINNALDKYPKGRESGAEALEKMSEREFNEGHANNAWIPETLKEVRQITKRTHPLIAALSQGRSNNDGSASYITDLTDWAGNKIHR